MTGPLGLPALDRTLLPKVCTDLWPDWASEVGGGSCEWARAPEPTPGARASWMSGKGQQIFLILWVRWGREGIWFPYLAVAYFLTVKSHLGLTVVLETRPCLERGGQTELPCPSLPQYPTHSG